MARRASESARAFPDAPAPAVQRGARSLERSTAVPGGGRVREMNEEILKETRCWYGTFTGGHLTIYEGSPKILDIAVGLGRIGRYGGQSKVFWPVLLHSMAVADLLPLHLEAHGLLHDAAEILIGDVPRAFKIPEVSALEKIFHARIVKHLGLEPMSPTDVEFVKHADNCV